MYGCSVSRTLTDEALDQVRRDIHALQREGRYGSAYLAKFHHLRRFPCQFTEADRDALEQIAVQFSGLLQSKYDPAWSVHSAPEPYWSSFVRSPLLPHEFLLIRYTTMRRHEQNSALALSNYPSYENRTDCLGRSVSHLHHDYGDKTDWRMGADVHAHDILGRTVLHYACREGNFDLVEKSLDAGANMLRPVVTGMGPLHFAARGGYTAICKRLWEADTHQLLPRGVRSLISSAPPTPVVCAAIAGKPHTVDYFCKHLLAQAELQQLATLLRAAILKGCLHVVEVLLSYKQHYNLHWKDNDGHDAMWHAHNLSHKNPEITAALRSAIGSNGPRRQTRESAGIDSLLQYDFARFKDRLYENVTNKKNRKTPWTLTIELDKCFLNETLVVGVLVKSLWPEDLIRVRRLTEEVGNKEALHSIDQAILSRVLLSHDFIASLGRLDLALIQTIAHEVRDENALKIIELNLAERERFTKLPDLERHYVPLAVSTELQSSRKRSRHYHDDGPPPIPSP